MGYIYADMHEAMKYGINEAIMLNFLRSWLNYNFHKKINMENSKPWIYLSFRQWPKYLPCFTTKQIRTIIKSLTKQNLLECKDFKRKDGKHTLSYTLSDEYVNTMENPSFPLCVPKWARSVCPNGHADTYYIKYNNIKNNTPYSPPTGEVVDNSSETPYGEILCLFKRELSGVPFRDTLTTSKKRLMKKIWNQCMDEMGEPINAMSLIEQVFTLIKQSDFLMGRVNMENGNPFCLTFNWIFNEKHWDDILSLKYNPQLRKKRSNHV